MIIPKKSEEQWIVKYTQKKRGDYMRLLLRRWL
jgi:hypothetical protein